ncbi:MAG: NifB/NifX family molybdenum-iron cluster-binding protein [Anaerolineales bacterium]|jgi:predicted Fe-Mo cluster-binding NifX family protein
MKIAITSSGKENTSPLNPRFGRCEYFIIIDTDTKEWKAVNNPAIGARGGAGTQAAQFIANQGAKAVISGRFGPNAFTTLEAAGLQAFVSVQETVDAALDKFLAGELEQITAATGPQKHVGGSR